MDALKGLRISAQGKVAEAAALGCGPIMIFSLFSSGLARGRCAKPEEKREVGWGAVLPRVARSRACPGLIWGCPFRAPEGPTSRVSPGQGRGSVPI